MSCILRSGFRIECRAGLLRPPGCGGAPNAVEPLIRWGEELGAPRAVLLLRIIRAGFEPFRGRANPGRLIRAAVVGTVGSSYLTELQRSPGVGEERRRKNLTQRRKGAKIRRLRGITGRDVLASVTVQLYTWHAAQRREGSRLHKSAVLSIGSRLLPRTNQHVAVLRGLARNRQTDGTEAVGIDSTRAANLDRPDRQFLSPPNLCAFASLREIFLLLSS
jgi:hypothetical protein